MSARPVDQLLRHGCQASALLGQEDECAEHGYLLIPVAYQQLAIEGNPRHSWKVRTPKLKTSDREVCCSPLSSSGGTKAIDGGEGDLGLVGEAAGDAEIGEIGVALLIQQDVARFHVAMDHPPAMGTGQGTTDLVEQP
jgi:hypothetical protein